MSNWNYGAAANGSNQWVTTDWIVGKVYKTGVNSVHLHFEVLLRKQTPVKVDDYYHRANYMIVDPYGYQSGSYYADQLESKPGCLWVVGCQY